MQDQYVDLLNMKNAVKGEFSLNGEEFLTGEFVTNVTVEKFLCYIKEGNTTYVKLISDQLRKRSLLIHSTIDKIKCMSLGPP